MGPRICVVGSSNMDLVVRTPRLPRPGETLAARSLTTCAGGKGGNQAVMAARLGARVTMVGKVGRDAFGAQLRRGYEAEGIDTTYLFEDDEPTGVAAVLVDDGGQNSIVVVAGANAAVTPRDVRKARKAIRSADLVVCQLEIPIESTVEALRIAAEADTQTIFNPAPAPRLPLKLPRVTWLVPNETELGEITRTRGTTLASLEKGAAKLRRATGSDVLLTLGARGALVVSAAPAWREKAPAVDAVDTSGAGDAFVGAFAARLGGGASVREAVRAAVAVAAFSVTRPGTQSSYPSRREARELLR